VIQFDERLFPVAREHKSTQGMMFEGATNGAKVLGQAVGW